MLVKQNVACKDTLYATFIFAFWKIFKTINLCGLLTCVNYCILIFQIVPLEYLKSKLHINVGIFSCIHGCISSHLNLARVSRCIATHLVIQHLLSCSYVEGPALKEPIV